MIPRYLMQLTAAGAVASMCWLGFQKSSDGRQPESWFFKTTADLVFQAKPLRIERAIECRSTTEGPISEATPAYYNTRHLISQRLPDGSGLMLVAARVCPENTPVQRGYNPVLLWADSADRPELIEAYYSNEAAQRGKAQMQLASIRVDAPFEESLEVSRSEFIDWNGSASRDPLPHGQRLVFVTAYAFEIPSAEWSQQEDVRLTLLGREASGAIEANSNLMTLLDDKFPIPDELWYRNGGFYPTAKHPSLEAISQNSPLRSRDVIPLRIENGSFVADFSARGTLAFYPADVARQFNRNTGPANASIAGHKVNGNRGAGTYIWLAESQRLFLVINTSFLFILNPK